MCLPPFRRNKNPAAAFLRRAKGRPKTPALGAGRGEGQVSIAGDEPLQRKQASTCASRGRAAVMADSRQA